jgi:hypothetical protein
LLFDPPLGDPSIVRLRPFLIPLSVVCFGCSLINAYDEVVTDNPTTGGGGTGGDGAAPTGGGGAEPAGGNGGTGGAGGSVPLPPLDCQIDI